MAHIVLLGDSILDNAAYVPGKSPVIEQLRSVLPANWKASLLAADGDVTEDVLTQITQLPSDASHLVVSCGGNDALRKLYVLIEGVMTIGEAMDRFARILAEFRSSYQKMLAALIKTGCNVTACTIYDRIPGLEANRQTALALFNEVILREAIGSGINLIDLRHICSEASDYSDISAIEPSEQGGNKIVTAISHLLIDGSSSNDFVHVCK